MCVVNKTFPSFVQHCASHPEVVLPGRLSAFVQTEAGLSCHAQQTGAAGQVALQPGRVQAAVHGAGQLKTTNSTLTVH